MLNLKFFAMLGLLVVYGALALATGVAIATSDGGGSFDPWTDDNSFH